MQNRGGGNRRRAVVLHYVSIGNLPRAGFTANLTHGLTDQRVALHVALGGVTATGVDRQLPTQFDAAVADPFVALAALAEPEPFERENDRRCEVVIDLGAFD